jgi:hypothetical protein
VELSWKNRPVVSETSTWQHTTLSRAVNPYHRRVSSPQSQFSADLRLRPLGHWDRQSYYHYKLIIQSLTLIFLFPTLILVIETVVKRTKYVSNWTNCFIILPQCNGLYGGSFSHMYNECCLITSIQLIIRRLVTKRFSAVRSLQPDEWNLLYHIAVFRYIL